MHLSCASNTLVYSKKDLAHFPILIFFLKKNLTKYLPLTQFQDFATGNLTLKKQLRFRVRVEILKFMRWKIIIGNSPL